MNRQMKIKEETGREEEKRKVCRRGNLLDSSATRLGTALVFPPFGAEAELRASQLSLKMEIERKKRQKKKANIKHQTQVVKSE